MARLFRPPPMLSLLPGDLYGEKLGEGPVGLLYLHGWARSHRDAAPVFASPCLEGVTTVAVDLPGFGATPLPPQVWGSREYAEALIPLVESFERPLVVLGHSRGGAIAVCLAAKRPDLIRGVVATGAPLLRMTTNHPAPLKYRMIRFGAKHGLISAQRLEEAKDRFGSADYRAASGELRDILVRVVNESYEQELDALSCPLELVWGRQDDAVPVAVAEAVTERVSSARLTVVEGIGHQTPSGCPEVLAEAAARLL